MVLVKNRQVFQLNRINSPEIDPHKHSQLITDKEQRQHNGVKTVSFLGKINSKWVRGLNAQNYKILIEYNIGENLDDLGHNDFF